MARVLRSLGQEGNRLAWAESVLRQAEHKVGIRQGSPLKAAAFDEGGDGSDALEAWGIGVAPGVTVGVSGSMGLLLAMVGKAVKEDGWVAFVGLPTLGAAAAREFGVDLTRTVFIPAPGSQVMRVLATVIDGFDVVAVGPEVAVSPGRQGSVVGRARSQETVLFVPPWPQVPIRVEAKTVAWHGVGQGYGYLREHHLAVEVRSPRGRYQSRAKVAGGKVEILGEVRVDGRHSVSQHAVG
ncbi:MAG TPA: hypothetical protein VK054_11195 [Beutenbergiaceae bacterium]|nr:hypothetical protein [Beutenbergiaceae bacterium]